MKTQCRPGAHLLANMMQTRMHLSQGIAAMHCPTPTPLPIGGSERESAHAFDSINWPLRVAWRGIPGPEWQIMFGLLIECSISRRDLDTRMATSGSTIKVAPRTLPTQSSWASLRRVVSTRRSRRCTIGNAKGRRVGPISSTSPCPGLGCRLARSMRAGPPMATTTPMASSSWTKWLQSDVPDIDNPIGIVI
ncbi:hypothetical protein B0T18DRAFT_492022, partial [Schizothecium vesticola]